MIFINNISDVYFLVKIGMLY